MESIMTIYFDLDGVLADFNRGVNELCQRLPIPQDEIDEAEEIELWESIRQVGHFYDKLEPIEGSLNLFNELRSKYNCEILSAIPKPKRNIKGAAWDKMSWCERYLGKDIPVNICYSAEKKNFADGNVLIDDYQCNIQRWIDAGGIGILFKNPDQVRQELHNLKIL